MPVSPPRSPRWTSRGTSPALSASLLPTRPEDNLVQRGLLQKEPAHKDEVARLLSAADATLGDSRVQGVSVASRFAMAYQAALGFSLMALRARGYRTSSHQPGQHSIAIQSLPLTVSFPQSDTNVQGEAAPRCL